MTENEAILLDDCEVHFVLFNQIFKIVYYFTALHSCSAKFRYGNKCWSAWSKPNWNSLAQTLEPEYDPGEVTCGLWVGRSQTYARPV